MKTKTVYTAEDGKEFDTPEACREHEQALVFEKLVGLTQDDIASLTAGKAPELALAIERCGRKLAETRIAAGGSTRKRKAAA